MKGKLIEQSNSVNFILAGRAVFTFLNTKTDNRFTYKVIKHKTNDIFFVSVLTNPDVYQYIGFIKDGVFKHTSKSKISNKAQSVLVFDFVFFKLSSNSLPEFIEVWHEGKCGKCGRSLTVPNSILSGFGPECSKIIKLSK